MGAEQTRFEKDPLVQASTPGVSPANACQVPGHRLLLSLKGKATPEQLTILSSALPSSDLLNNLLLATRTLLNMPPASQAMAATSTASTAALSFPSSHTFYSNGARATEVVSDLASPNTHDFPEGVVFSNGDFLLISPLFLVIGALGWVGLMAGLIYCCRRRPGSAADQRLRSQAEKNTKLCGHHGSSYADRPVTTEDDHSYNTVAPSIFGSLARQSGKWSSQSAPTSSNLITHAPDISPPPTFQEAMNPFADHATLDPFIAGEKWTGPDSDSKDMLQATTAPLNIRKSTSTSKSKVTNLALSYAARQANKSGLDDPTYLAHEWDPTNPFQDRWSGPGIPEPEPFYPDQAPLPPPKLTSEAEQPLTRPRTSRAPTAADVEAEQERYHLENQEDAPLVLNASPEKRTKYRKRPESPQRVAAPLRAQGPRPRMGFSQPSQKMTMQEYTAQRASRRRSSADTRPVRMKSTSTARGGDLVRTRTGLSATEPYTPRFSSIRSHRRSQTQGSPETRSGPTGPRPRSPVRPALKLRPTGSVASEPSPPPNYQHLPPIPHPTAVEETGTTFTSRWFRGGYGKVHNGDPTLSRAPKPPSSFLQGSVPASADVEPLNPFADQRVSRSSNAVDLNNADPYADTEPLYTDVVRSPSSKRREELMNKRYDDFGDTADEPYDPYTNVDPLYSAESVRRPPSNIQDEFSPVQPPGQSRDLSRSSRKKHGRQSRPNGLGSAYGRRYRRTSDDPVAAWVSDQRDAHRVIQPMDQEEP